LGLLITSTRMTRATLLLFVPLASAEIASAIGGSSSYVQDKCHKLLAGVVTEGHSHFEVAAVCRARFPSNLCREGLKRLGRQPWSVETMRSACASWDAEWKAHAVGPAPARRTQDLVSAIDYTMEKKHELGICKAMSFEECLQYKATTYPKIAENVTRVIKVISADASVMAKGDQGAQPTYPGIDAAPAPATVAESTPATVAEWADFRKTLNSSGQQSQFPWAMAGFAAGMGAGALLVARATSGLRRTSGIMQVDGTQDESAE